METHFQHKIISVSFWVCASVLLNRGDWVITAKHVSIYVLVRSPRGGSVQHPAAFAPASVAAEDTSVGRQSVVPKVPSGCRRISVGPGPSGPNCDCSQQHSRMPARRSLLWSRAGWAGRTTLCPSVLPQKSQLKVLPVTACSLVM